jgi:protein-L-isoaspartate(D-aspartate) O-methyltransferase
MGLPPDRLSGIGMTSVRTRTRMIERLREQGIRDEVVLAAMNAIPRHIFVDEALAIRAYEDTPLPIGNGQTISQPWVVARMSELARNGRTPFESVLEIGTGCGYQAAVLAQFTGTVYTVERIRELVAKARRHLQALKIRNVRIKHGDGTADLGEELAVDAIVVTACATHVPSGLLRYLRPGGRLVLPLATAGDGERLQRLTVIEPGPGGYREQAFDPVRFVPLLPGIA